MIELLVSVAIIGTLVALLCSVFPKVLANADRASCAAGLRTMGGAILAYASEHDQQLPGPLYGGQGYIYGTGIGSSLLTFTSIYLPIPSATASEQVAKPMLCPAWKRKISDPTKAGKCFAVNISVTLSNGKSGVAPFGYPPSGSSPAQQPQRLTAIKSLSATYSLVDMDQVNKVGYKGDPLVPTTAVHGNSHNTLFLDSHVETVAIP